MPLFAAAVVSAVSQKCAHLLGITLLYDDDIIGKIMIYNI